MKMNLFIGKHVTLTLKTGFVINGKILESDEHGIVFETPQKVSWISYDAIKSVV